MLWHYRLGHCGQGWVQDLMRQRKGPVGEPSEITHIPTRFTSAKSCEHVKCGACLMAKQHRTGTGAKPVLFLSSTTVFYPMRKGKTMAARLSQRSGLRIADLAL